MFAGLQRNNNGACGTFTVHAFARTMSECSSHCYTPIEITKENLQKQLSVGVFYAGFRAGDSLSEDMFALLSSLATPVYISPEKVNPNSGKLFYFAVFELDAS